MGPIKKRKLADAVLDEIRRMIQAGELKEGDKLPNQNEFAARLGVSRTSLREAMHTLNLLGAIEQRPGYGTVIRARGPALYGESLSPPWTAAAPALVDLLEARRLIEVGAVELAVSNATEEEIQQMGSQVEAMGKALLEAKIDDYTEKDVAFHHLIANASHNPYLIHFLATIRGMMEQYIRDSFQGFPGYMKRSFKFHREIYDAIRKRDRSRAASQMKKHIQDMQTGLERYYGTAASKDRRLELKGGP